MVSSCSCVGKGGAGGGYGGGGEGVEGCGSGGGKNRSFGGGLVDGCDLEGIAASFLIICSATFLWEWYPSKWALQMRPERGGEVPVAALSCSI